MSLAEELLRTGDTARALQFADPVLGIVTMPTLDFLTLLREKNPAAAADQRYAAMLANTRGDLMADANTVSLLSSYIFTPQVYVIFDRYGAPSSSMMPFPPPPPNVAPQVRLAFFQTAAAVLLRSQAPADQEQSTAGVLGKYMVVRRLMPLFERYAQRETAEALRGQLEALNVLVGDGARQADNEWEKKGLSPEKPLGDQEQTLLDQIERATMSAERNELYFKLALLTLSKGDMRARDYASKIDETGFRKQARTWVDASLAITAVEKKKVDTVLELARTGELTNIQRVWVLTQAAKLLSATDRDRALSVLEEAITESRRIQGYDADRPRRLLAIANAVRLVEPSRVWNALSDAVEAANSTDGFTGEGGALTLLVSSRSLISSRTYNVPDFDVAGIFREVANDSYDSAVQLALGFKGEAARASAAIAVARAGLNEKGTPGSCATAGKERLATERTGVLATRPFAPIERWPDAGLIRDSKGLLVAQPIPEFSLRRFINCRASDPRFLDDSVLKINQYRYLIHLQTPARHRALIIEGLKLILLGRFEHLVFVPERYNVKEFDLLMIIGDRPE